MSYFLEDINSNNYGIYTDYTGINECMFNAEIAWSNIMESAMKNEYQAIKNEDSVALREGISDFFEAIKDWFKKMIQSITRVIANIKNKILLKTNYYGKWALSMAKKLRNAQTKINRLPTNKTITISKVMVTKASVVVNMIKKLAATKLVKQSVKDIINGKVNLSNTYDKSDYSDDIETINKVYRECMEWLTRAKTNTIEIGCNSGNKNIKRLITSNSVKVYLDEIKNGSQDVSKTIKAFKNAQNVCKIGIRYADKEDKDHTTTCKWISNLINQVSSRYLNLAMSAISFMKSQVSKLLNPIISATKDKDFDTEYDKASDKIVTS